MRWLRRGAIALLVLLLAGFGTGWWLMRGSLATLDGDVALAGLSAPVHIERDAIGVVTIHAANETDALRALGYAHAQERYFEMDLLRRSAAGELSELFGPIALDIDKSHRVHRFRARALDQMQTIAGDHMPQLKAYVDGVNAGLADLKVRPWPYLLLQSKPEPWQLSDTALAGYAMFFDLQGGDNERELALWRIKQAVPEALYRLVAADGTEWDAPLEGVARGNVPLPDAATLDLRKLPAPGFDGHPPYADPDKPGSNNFAVAGPLTKDGRAIVANDMHLGLRAPNIWFRARLLYDDAKARDGKVDVSGFTLPGVPGVIVGSNTHVAWGFTNSYGDWMDWVEDCRPDQDHPCLPPDKADRILDEHVAVKGGSQTLLEVVERQGGTRRPDVAGPEAALSLHWNAHEPGALSLGSLEMARAANIADGLLVMNHAGIPPQNLMIADAYGRVAWSIAGRIPAIRPSPDAWPLMLCNGQSGSNAGWCSHWDVPKRLHLPIWIDRNPSVADPSSNRLWTANNRVTDGDDLAIIGDSGYALGARAKQIRDDLFAKQQFTERDLLAIQLDDRTLFLERWWKQLRALVQGSNDPALRRIEAATRHWDAHATPDAVTYRIVRAWRLQVLDRIEKGLLAPAEVALGKDFTMPGLEQLEGVAWQLLTQRPAHLLPRTYATWDALLVDAAHQADADLGKHGALAQRTWGERNTAAICHPLAGAMPSFLKRFLCMPPDALPGGDDMPRIATPDFGASERMVVSPGHEADGIIEMPAGQSGNPLSPFWGAGHAAWVRGEPTPFLPGAATHALTLSPPH